MKKFSVSITPYLSLIDRSDCCNEPVFRQAFPDAQELHFEKCDMVDPLAEDTDSLVPGITHRHPDAGCPAVPYYRCSGDYVEKAPSALDQYPFQPSA